MLSREIAVYVEHYKKIFYDILEIDFKNEIVTIKIDDKNKQIPFRHCKAIQYTGVKDRNGKKIFEGDILKGHNGFIYRVWIVKGGFAINVPVEKFKNDIKMDYPFPLQSLADEQTCSYVESQCEIIGNIFENPELLK